MGSTKRRCGNSLRLVALAALQLVWVGPAWADDAQRIQELEKQLTRSMQLIEQLNQRVQQLEGQRGVPAAAATNAAPADSGSARMDHMAPVPMATTDGVRPVRDTGLPIHAFSDVGYVSGRTATAGRRPGFALGNLDLYFSPEIGPRVRSLVELVFEFDSEGLSTDLERLEFGYVFSDWATLWMGRWHTPYGYWNDAFHHGAQMQTAVSRPRFLDFEDRGGILPAHGVGLLLQGGTRTGAGRVQYDAYVANGDSIKDHVLDMNTFADDNGNKMVGGNVRYQFGGGLEGLMLGVHGLTQNVASYEGATQTGRTKMNMLGGFAVYENNNWEVISEYYRFRDHDDFTGTGSHDSWAAFAQVGYNFAAVWTPYYRWEKAALDQGDNYFAAQESGRPYRQNVLGVRYDLNPNAALKLELGRIEETQVDGSVQRSNAARFQFAVRF
jgi:hypothetical protein